MVYPCQIEHFKLKIVDLYTNAADGKTTGKQFFYVSLKFSHNAGK